MERDMERDDDTMTGDDVWLTSQQAADLLRMTRPVFTRAALRDTAACTPCPRTWSPDLHRYLYRRSDVLAWRRSRPGCGWWGLDDRKTQPRKRRTKI